MRMGRDARKGRGGGKMQSENKCCEREGALHEICGDSPAEAAVFPLLVMLCFVLSLWQKCCFLSK